METLSADAAAEMGVELVVPARGCVFVSLWVAIFIANMMWDATMKWGDVDVCEIHTR